MKLRGLLLLPIACAFATSASADNAAGPSFAELPVGRLTSTPWNVPPPAAIPATESVRGFHVAGPKDRKPYGSSAAPVVVAGRPTTVEEAQRGQVKPDDLNYCFSPIDVRGGVTVSEELKEWRQPSGWSAFGYSARIGAAHSERFVEGDGSARLESTDAWIDTTTRGTRLLTKATLPLKLVRSLPGGVKVYAGRDERSDGKRFVQFVVTHPIEEDLRNQTIVIGGEGLPQGGSTCGFSRAAVRVGEGGGTASVQLTAVLPPLGPDEKGPANPNPPLEPGAKGKDLRVRTMRIHVSVSQSSRDKEPLVSVAPGWTTREAIQRVFPGTNRFASPFIGF